MNVILQRGEAFFFSPSRLTGCGSHPAGRHIYLPRFTRNRCYTLSALKGREDGF